MFTASQDQNQDTGNNTKPSQNEQDEKLTLIKRNKPVHTPLKKLIYNGLHLKSIIQDKNVNKSISKSPVKFVSLNQNIIKEIAAHKKFNKPDSESPNNSGSSVKIVHVEQPNSEGVKQPNLSKFKAEVPDDKHKQDGYGLRFYDTGNVNKRLKEKFANFNDNVFQSNTRAADSSCKSYERSKSVSSLVNKKSAIATAFDPSSGATEASSKELIYVTVPDGYWAERFKGDLVPKNIDMLFVTQDAKRNQLLFPLQNFNNHYIYRRNILPHYHCNFFGVSDEFGPILISITYDVFRADRREFKGVLDKNSALRVQSKAPSTSSDTLNRNEIDQCCNDVDFETSVLFKANKKYYHLVLIRTKKGDYLCKIPESQLVRRRSRTLLNMLISLNVYSPFLHKVEFRKLHSSAVNSIIQIEDKLTPRTYKFGVFYMTGQQETESEALSNYKFSSELNKFMKNFSKKIELTGWNKFAGGLDVKHETTGKYAYYSGFRGYEIMFHVSLLLPHVDDDEQQLEKKRHIGNDIVCIIFHDGERRVDLKTFKSFFNHVFIVVHLLSDEELSAMSPELQDTSISPASTGKSQIPSKFLLKKNSSSMDDVIKNDLLDSASSVEHELNYKNFEDSNINDAKIVYDFKVDSTDTPENNSDETKVSPLPSKQTPVKNSNLVLGQHLSSPSILVHQSDEQCDNMQNSEPSSLEKTSDQVSSPLEIDQKLAQISLDPSENEKTPNGNKNYAKRSTLSSKARLIRSKAVESLESIPQVYNAKINLKMKKKLFNFPQKYRIEIVSKKGVVESQPPLPNPPIFTNGPYFKEYLLTKLINYERAAYFSMHFSTPFERTRESLLNSIE